MGLTCISIDESSFPRRIGRPSTSSFYLRPSDSPSDGSRRPSPASLYTLCVFPRQHGWVSLPLRLSLWPPSPSTPRRPRGPLLLAAAPLLLAAAPLLLAGQSHLVAPPRGALRPGLELCPASIRAALLLPSPTGLAMARARASPAGEVRASSSPAAPLSPYSLLPPRARVASFLLPPSGASGLELAGSARVHGGGRRIHMGRGGSLPPAPPSPAGSSSLPLRDYGAGAPAPTRAAPWNPRRRRGSAAT